jgi:5'-methylthioadenosine phosphorylase
LRRLKNKPKSLETARIGIIGGSGFEKLFKNDERVSLKTPYGAASPLFLAKMESGHIAFLPRHGPDHSIPPHKINCRANVCALHRLGVRRILATNTVGAINRKFRPDDLVVPHDFVDFTRCRCATFYDEAPVTRVDFSQPYCPELRMSLIESAGKMDLRVWEKAILVCTEGPRFETPAEIRMFRRLGCGVVGMTGFPEASLARELEMCYATICCVLNMAAGMQKGLSCADSLERSKRICTDLEKVLIEVIRGLRLRSRATCPCVRATENARFT